MSILITADSLQLIAADPSNTPSNLLLNFNPPLQLGDLNWELSLFTLNTWFTTPNVNNNTIVWSSNGGVTNHTLTIANGVYTVQDINALLLADQTAKGVTGTAPDQYGLQIVPNFNTNKARIIVDNAVSPGTGDFPPYNFQIDLTQPNSLANFLGFVPAVITTSQDGTLIPNVNAGINQWQVRCDAIRNTLQNGMQADILYGFVPQVPPSANIYVNPLHLAYFQVKNSTLYNMRLQLTDQNANLLNMAGSDVTITLHIRRIGARGE